MGRIDIKLDSEKDLTIITVIGNPGLEEYLKVTKKFYEKEVTKYALIDMSESDVSSVSPTDIQTVAFTPPEYSKKRAGGKTAIVAPKDITFGLSRMYETMKEMQNLPFPTMAFRTQEEAYDWLFSSE